VETLLNAILMMIGYYIVILTAAMILIVVGIQIFKALSAGKQLKEAVKTKLISSPPSEEIGEELAAAVAAVSIVLSSEKQVSVSGWSLVERGMYSPWKVSSRARRISAVGG